VLLVFRPRLLLSGHRVLRDVNYPHYIPATHVTTNRDCRQLKNITDSGEKLEHSTSESGCQALEILRLNVGTLDFGLSTAAGGRCWPQYIYLRL
jgi:hypothetical protein